MQIGNAGAAAQAQRAQVLKIIDRKGHFPEVRVALDAELPELPRREGGAVSTAVDTADIPQREYLQPRGRPFDTVWGGMQFSQVDLLRYAQLPGALLCAINATELLWWWRLFKEDR